MSSKPWIAWYPADFRRKTSHLDFVQSEAYRRLLEAYYENRGGLTNNKAGLYRICSAMNETEQAAVDFAVTEFFSCSNEHLANQRADEEIAKQDQMHQRLSAAGRRGGRIGGKARPKHTHIHIPQAQQVSGSTEAPISNLETKTSARKKLFTRPEWVPEKQWNAWVEARITRRNPPTEWAKHLAILRLQDLQKQGHSPAAVLAESAFNGWAGLFPLRKEK